MNSTKSLDEILMDCEREPIHIPGSIQPHGIMMTLRSSDLTILQISESVFDLVGIHHSELLHQPLSRLMPIAPVEKALKRLGDRTPRLLNPIPIEISAGKNTARFDGILHRSGRVVILELEKHVSEDRGYGGFGGFYEAIREVTSQIMVTDNLSEVLAIACEEVRKLTGFDRVLAYRFDIDWNGEVVQESKLDHVPSLMHHHFPASDIPKQARELYTSNWLRLIPNADYTPAKMVPAINPITDKPLDMSNAVLRSVSPVHLEYMKNMGQVASMSISLLKGRTLWGLISCHNSRQLYLKYDVRVAAEFIGQMVSAQTLAREDNAEIDHKLQLKKLYDELLRIGGSFAQVTQSFASNAASLLGLVNAHGAAICINEEIQLVGSTPSEDEIKNLREWFRDSREPIYSSARFDQLKNISDDFLKTGAGMLGIRISERGDSLFWFRPELNSQEMWAGDPDSHKVVSSDGKIHPRKSFETWLKQSKGASKKWLPIELDAADELRTALGSMSISQKLGQLTGNESQTEIFRNSLQNAIATAEKLGKESRDENENQEVKSMFTEAALDSRLLLEGFAEFAVLFLDLQGRIQNWSPGARRLLSYESRDVLGQPLDILFSEEDALSQKLEKILDQVNRRDRSESEMWLYRSNQTSFWAKMLVAEVRDKTGPLIGFSVIIEDITRERSYEEELKATKLSAEAANKSKSAFLANMSHEIRTPLGAVLGFSELMSADDLSKSERAELFGRIKRNGEQLTVLINDLLDISKVESGKIETEILEFDLQTLLTDVEKLFSIKALEKKLGLKLTIKGAIPKTISSDPTRLRQILINLIGNAIKFTPEEGSVAIEVSTRRILSSELLVIKVTDTGRGMTEEEMSKLFQPFTQADVSTTRVYGGSGLGLFLSQRLARALGGDVWIEHSQVGVGTSFVCSISLAGVSSFNTIINLTNTKSPDESETSNPVNLEGLKILVVDDSKDNRDLIKIYLEKANAVVALAENGLSGVEYALNSDFDLVLMDVQMPILDGNAAMRRLRDMNYPKPVIALTAHAMKTERENSFAAGFKEYLTKPINRNALLKTIFELTK